MVAYPYSIPMLAQVKPISALCSSHVSPIVDLLELCGPYFARLLLALVGLSLALCCPYVDLIFAIYLLPYILSRLLLASAGPVLTLSVTLRAFPASVRLCSPYVHPFPSSVRLWLAWPSVVPSLPNVNPRLDWTYGPRGAPCGVDSSPGAANSSSDMVPKRQLRNL